MINYSVAIKTLKQDPILADVILQIGECRLNQIQQTGDLFYCLSRAIIYQQLSGKAAQFSTPTYLIVNYPFSIINC